MKPPRSCTESRRRPLPRAFYQRSTAVVARDLLGRILVSRADHEEVGLRITEVEAYLGPRDPACHTSGGRRTRRVASMYGEAGRAYVYLIYGMHRCLNVVTVGGGAGEAVLIRAGSIEWGSDVVVRRRGEGMRRSRLTDGPGKLGQAVGLSLSHDGLDLTDPGSDLWIADAESQASVVVAQTPRIGIPNAGKATDWRLRWVLRPSS